MAQDWMLTDAHIIALLKSGVTKVALGRSITYEHYGDLTMVYFLKPAAKPLHWTEVAHLSPIVDEVLWFERSWGTGENLEAYEVFDWTRVVQRWQEGSLYAEPIESVRTHVASVHRVV